MIRYVLMSCMLSLTTFACAVDRPTDSTSAGDESSSIEQAVYTCDVYPCKCDVYYCVYSCSSTDQPFMKTSHYPAQACVLARGQCEASCGSTCTLEGNGPSC